MCLYHSISSQVSIHDTWKGFLGEEVERCWDSKQSKKANFHLPRFTLKLHWPLSYESHFPLPPLHTGDVMKWENFLNCLHTFLWVSTCWVKWAKLEVVRNKSLPFTPFPIKQGRAKGGTFLTKSNPLPIFIITPKLCLETNKK